MTVVLLILFTESALFAEPRVGKGQSERLEDSKSYRNCRLIYSLLAGMATITTSLLADRAAIAAAIT